MIFSSCVEILSDFLGNIFHVLVFVRDWGSVQKQNRALSRQVADDQRKISKSNLKFITAMDEQAHLSGKTKVRQPSNKKAAQHEQQKAALLAAAGLSKAIVSIQNN